MIDSHCHLADEVFAADLADVVGRARAAGVHARDDASWRRATRPSRLRAARGRGAWPEIRFAVGVHPHQARRLRRVARPRPATVRQRRGRNGRRAAPSARSGWTITTTIRRGTCSRRCSPPGVARRASWHLPIVIHTREAADDTFAILQRAGRAASRGVFHCFTGDVAMARTALDLGFYISVCRDRDVSRVSRDPGGRGAFVPADRLLIETDSPYLAPSRTEASATSRRSWRGCSSKLAGAARSRDRADSASNWSPQLRPLLGSQLFRRQGLAR